MYICSFYDEKKGKQVTIEFYVQSICFTQELGIAEKLVMYIA